MKITKSFTWIVLAIVLAVYGIVAASVGFQGPVALTIHFIRIVVTVAALVQYIPMLPSVFQEVPAPRRDYLLAGIVFMLLSAVCFSFWNEAGRIFGVDTSIFTGPIAGLFSMFLIVGGSFVLVAPDTGGKGLRRIAVAVGITLAVWLVFIAPMFRE